MIFLGHIIAYLILTNPRTQKTDTGGLRVNAWISALGYYGGEPLPYLPQ